jgi:putative methyltransferase (TIGR04325 family)
MMKKLIRSVASTARDLHGYWSFHRTAGRHRYRGVYSSYSEAAAAMPAKSLKGFDHESVAEFFVDTNFIFNPADYPVLFWLSQIVAPWQRVFDFGGGVGQCFYLYRQFLHFPEGLRWLVCDLQAFAHRGERLAREKEVSALEFTTAFADADGAEVLFTGGALHYMEMDLSELLSGLNQPPKHVIIQRVPMYHGPTYYTVQHSEHSYAPYKVMDVGTFVRGMEALNYEKIDEWHIPRAMRIPFHAQRAVPHFWGFYFQLKAS